MKTQILPILMVCAGGFALAGEEYSGGETTVFQNGQNSFSMPLANISREKRREHVVGNSFFNKNWVVAPASTTARDGLGPLFHARSCSECHSRDGRAAPPEEGELMTGLLFRLSVPGKGPHGDPLPDPNYGGQLGVRAIPGADPEGNVKIEYEDIVRKFGDGTPYTLRKPIYTLETSGKYGDFSPDILFSPRIAPPVFGVGLLEAIPAETIQSFADPDDKDGDGISGRPNFVWHVEKEKMVIGRFGWKANQPDVRQQTASAFLGDIGITSSIHPRADFSEGQLTILQTLKSGLDPDDLPELEDKLLDRTVTYQLTLAPPARRNWKDEAVVRGRELFEKINCTACHLPELKTGEFPDIPELANQTIHPFTDMLLHDMGEDLADNRPDGEADGREWRTSPLWGIGLTEVVNGHTRFLHDGRARNLEEAVLWHGGESEASRTAFENLNETDRLAVLKFLESL